MPIELAGADDRAALRMLFDPFESAVLFLAVIIVNQALADGRTNWMEGLILFMVYVLIAVAFWVCPRAFRRQGTVADLGFPSSTIPAVTQPISSARLDAPRHLARARIPSPRIFVQYPCTIALIQLSVLLGRPYMNDDIIICSGVCQIQKTARPCDPGS